MTTMARAAIVGMLLCFGLAVRVLPAGAADGPTIEVWKSATCGCCRAWVKHLQDAGFNVRVTELEDVAPIKRQFKVPPELSSCHTALVDGYVVEGHVPAADIMRMLKERPKIKGIYLPGMPVGSPGMEGPNGDKYDVLALDDAGKVTVFATHQP
jgi:hypothetical protein